MSDHPVFVPTSSGPVGGIVTEPDGRLRAAAVILEGVGGRRFGVNRVLTRTAWALAHLAGFAGIAAPDLELLGAEEFGGRAFVDHASWCQFGDI